jgi:putative Mg2+ transporter-C (MgtC) family protein
MLVCMGAALTMVLGTYLAIMLGSELWGLDPTDPSARTDVSRFGAQVINGIGFIGAGTILITGHQQVKGMTTAAGLWASACMGLAIGAGFYTAALIGCFLIITTIVIFSKLETVILAHTRDVNLYVELEHAEDISSVIQRIKALEVRIYDVEISKGSSTSGVYPSAILSLQLPKKKSHTLIMTAIAENENVRIIEEV